MVIIIKGIRFYLYYGIFHFSCITKIQQLVVEQWSFKYVGTRNTITNPIVN